MKVKIVNKKKSLEEEKMKVRNSEIQPRLAYTLIKLKIVISKWKVSKMTKWDNIDMIYTMRIMAHLQGNAKLMMF